MTLRLIRARSVNGTTNGILFVDDRLFGFTVEDEIRGAGQKVPGETAIPAGRYRIGITYSNKFARPMPEILAVPDFTGIRIHAMNTSRESKGCIGVGYVLSGLAIQSSQPAVLQLQSGIAGAIARGEDVWIGIENPWSWEAPL